MAARDANQHHRSYLQNYLSSHSSRSQSRTKQGEESVRQKKLSINRESTFTKKRSGPVQADRRPFSSGNVALKENQPRLQILPKINSRGKANAEILPDELLSAIFWKLQVGDLIVASQVCRRWYRVAGDNLLWKKYYKKFVGPTSNEPEDTVPIANLDRFFWKYICLKRCKAKRDQIYLKKWKHPDRYTGLKQRPELTLGKVGVRFELSFIGSDSQRSIHCQSHDDLFWLTTSASVRWYGLVFPDIALIRGLEIHACSPLMFYGPAKPAKDGIHQKSLVLSIKSDLKDVLSKKNPLGEDEHIQLFELVPGLLIARYKVDNELAFVLHVLHYHNLVSRCLSGSDNQSWSIPKYLAPKDDIDPHYGLQSYSCVFIVRNTRQKLIESKFSDLYTRRDSLVGDFAVFSPVRKDDKMSHITCLKDISFPWRTTLFKGIVQNVAILDMTILGEGGEPFWTALGMISFHTRSVQTDQFEFSPESYRHAVYKDETGQVEIEIGQLDDGTSYLSRLDIMISLSTINHVYHTSYGDLKKRDKQKSATETKNKAAALPRSPKIPK